jgi:hypothetical protein
MKKRDKQNLREDFIDLVKKDLNVDLELRDVVAIHCLPSDRPGEKTIIVRLFNSDAKRNVMRAKKNLKNNVRFVDDITKQNHELMKRMRDSNRFDSVWFFLTRSMISSLRFCLSLFLYCFSSNIVHCSYFVW